MVPATTVVMEVSQLEALNAKLDALTGQISGLTEQVTYLREKAYKDSRRQQSMDELMEDATPVVQDMYNMTVDQLEEIQGYVDLEDIGFLLKRLARNTRTFTGMLDQLESAQDFVKDAAPLVNDMMEQSVETLQQMEQKGYFGFVRQAGYIMDNIVSSFSEEDVRLLGDNVVLILNTVKALTQPEIMNLAGNLTTAFQEAEAHADELPTSLFGIMGQMRDPDVRRGLAVTMQALKTISKQQPRAGVANGKPANGRQN